MKSRILDQKTLGAVVAAGPEKPSVIIEARNVLHALDNYAAGKMPELNNSMRVSELAEKVGIESPRRVGAILTDLGLETVRLRDGFHVFYNHEQLKILRGALLAEGQVTHAS